MTSKDLEVLMKAVPTIVEWRKVEQGIALRPVNQPALESIVEIPIDLRDKVWEWLCNPKIVEDVEEWKRLRKPIFQVVLEIVKIMTHYGNTLQREIFSRILKELSQSR